jgi:hypothetical protein
VTPDPEQPVAPGWYRDPLGIPGSRYWDGSRWTDSTTSDRVSAAPRGRGRLVVGIGGLALAVSVFLPWLNLALQGDLNLFQTLHALGDGQGIGWVALLLGSGVTLLAFVLEERQVQPVGVLVGLFGGLGAIFWALHLVSVVHHTEGFSSLSIGPWVAVAACAAMFVGGMLSSGSTLQVPIQAPAAGEPGRPVEVAGVLVDPPEQPHP